MSKQQAQQTPVESLIFGITDEAYTPRRSAPVSKYDAVFAKLKPGQRVVCAAESASKIKGALDKWLSNHGHKGAITKAKTRCPDGKGGVWWLPAPPATCWQPTHNPLAAVPGKARRVA